ncbi:MAG: InlB B-repeat-containing protein [Oscillospiraceae bacterium]|nr:InlB B-repeat-containing protein [Oscillospiraceae bacterium]
MARSEARGLFYKFIWILVLTVALVLSVLGSRELSTVGLEQKSRCGQVEHVHSAECYMDSLLLCDRKAHTHDENCYLLLLRDNNINVLLEMLENSGGQSLEDILSAALWVTVGDSGRLTSERIAMVNEVLAQSNSFPTLLLNRDLTGTIQLEDLDTGSGDGYAMLDLPDNPNTRNRAINFYIYVADADNPRYLLVSVGTLENGNPDYYSATNTAAAYQSADIVSAVTNRNLLSTYFLRYTTKANSTAFDSTATQSYYGIGFGNTNSPRYAVLTTRTGWNNSYSYPAVNFYTVTLDYSLSGDSKTNEVQYVQSGIASELDPSSGYLWYSSATDTTPGDTLPSAITQKTTLYARLPRTVTFNSMGGSTVASQTVGNGLKATKPVDPTNGDQEFLGWYTDEDGTNAFDFANTAITGNITLYAKWKPKNVTANFYSNGTLLATQTLPVTSGTVTQPSDPPARTGYTFCGWCTDDGCSDPNCDDKVSFPTTITQNTNYYAIWALNQYEVSVNLVDASGQTTNTWTQTVNHGGTITLDEGYTWTDQNGTAYPGGSTVTITGDMTFTGRVITHQVTITDENGNVTTQTVEHGDTVTLPALPEGYVWIGSDGTDSWTYTPGDVTITSDMTFTAVTRNINVNYNVNFPSNAVNKVDSVPTLFGTTSATATDLIPGGSPVTTRTLTSRKAREEINSSNKESLTHFFEGWLVAGTDILIEPGTRLTWAELEQYADSDGNVNLVGQWVGGTWNTSATFYVRYDSVAVDTDGNTGGHDSNLYTPELFNTFVGGVDPGLSEGQLQARYGLADVSSDNSYTVDQEIRALYGKKSSGVWLYDFPDDDAVFYYLKNNLPAGKTLSVDGDPVNMDELDKQHYAIRWYVFKCQNDAWHIDGKLVRREGSITVDKHFAGDTAAIDLAENGFYILAENGTRDDAGVFTPYASSDSRFKQHILLLDETRKAELQRMYPNAEFQIYDAAASNASAHSYQWEIKGVVLDEYWRITEFPAEDSGLKAYSYYAEYSVFDTDGSYSAIAEYGTRASVVGKTFALDEDPDQGMMVDFQNYYYNSDSILLKKEDGMTGLGLPGAQFQILQKGQALKFDYDPDTGIYSQNADAQPLPKDDPNYRDLTVITTNDSGFAILTNFSYLYDSENGAITIREISAPTGYDPAYTVTLSKQGDTVAVTDVAGIVDPALYPKYAEVHVDYLNQDDTDPTNDVTVEAAVIKDYTSETISVTATKVWNTEVPAESVDVVLQANGGNAAALMPGLENAQMVLNEANGWTCTWTDLPRYVNGQLVTWGIKEVKVGTDPTLSDGTTFANWVPTYSPGVGTDDDGDGDVDIWSYAVTNTIRRPMLILTKVDAGNRVLSGATFTLEQVELKNGAWQVVASVPVETRTTDETGVILFDNLSVNAYYRVTETSPPEGYFSPFESIVLSVNGIGEIKQVLTDGTLTEVSGGMEVTSPYNAKVVNLSTEPLPETGSVGKPMYTQLGLLLMAVAAVLYIYQKWYRREDVYSS